MLCVCALQLAEINRHPWVTAGGKGELELELPMMEVVQTHVIPTASAVDPDVLNAICSLGCFKEKEKLIQELLSARYEQGIMEYVLYGHPNCMSLLSTVTTRKRSFISCSWSANDVDLLWRMMRKLHRNPAANWTQLIRPERD